jgi:hypothetical protein
MTRNALLMGAPLAGRPRALRGVENDIEAVAGLLALYGFECERCTGSAATRAHILDRMEHLIARSRAGDAVVVYFSGHGGMVVNTGHIPDLKTPEYNPKYHQFLVPEDFHDAGDGNFRGILDIELAYLIARLAEQTRNVTVILDCCHSGGMVRKHRSCQVKALDPKSIKGDVRRRNRAIEQRLKELGARIEREGAVWPALDPDTNPHVVRLEATRSDCPAYELEIGGRMRGLFTAALVGAIEEHRGRPVTWEAVRAKLRMGMARHLGEEHWPGITGPRHRLLFQLEESSVPGAVGLVRRGDAFFLLGGTLYGIQVGDQFRILPAAAGDADGALGYAIACEVEPDSTRVELVCLDAELSMMEGARAVPLRRSGPWRGVDVRACGAVRAMLLRLIEATGTLAPYLGDGAFLARISEITGEMGSSLVAIQDARGCVVTAPMHPGEAVIPVLQRLQRAAIVRGLQSGSGAHELISPFDVHWWRASDATPARIRYVREGLLEGMSGGPVVVVEDEEIRVDITNMAPARNPTPPILYLSILDVDVDGRVSLHTRAEPSGVALHAAESHSLGHRPHGGPRPLRMRWPAEVPRRGPGLRSLVIVVADRPHDVHVLETCDLDAHAVEHGLVLPAIAEAPEREGTRSSRVPDVHVSEMRYAVVCLDFEVMPKA